MFGLLAIDKPAGPTSHDIVAGIRRRLGRGAKVGHAGTLDPFARGVLVVCLGQATRLADYVQAQPKRYLAVARLGATSTTDDPEGEIVQTPPAAPPDLQAIEQAVAQFVGRIEQIPPAHSAVHVDGQRAYQLARAGKAVTICPRPVTIHSIDIRRYDWPRLELDVRCGSGTYLRALARDLGQVLGVGGYCEELARLAIGEFTLERAIAPDLLDVTRDLLAPTEALGSMPRIALSPDQFPALRNGSLLNLPEPAPEGQVALVDADGNLLALAETRAEGWQVHPRKVFLGADD